MRSAFAKYRKFDVGDFCNRRSIKCSENGDSLGRCRNCMDFDVACTFDRPMKRRGIKAGTRARGRDSQFVRGPVNHTISTAASIASGRRASGSSNSHSPYRASVSADYGWSATELDADVRVLHNSWKAFAIACDRQIRNLVQVYFEIVYPMYDASLILLADCAD
jgi:hypothetical protein